MKPDDIRDAASEFCDARVQVWNVNRYSGIVGAFHLQGASWSRTRRQFLVHDETPPPLATQVRCPCMKHHKGSHEYVHYFFMETTESCAV